MINTINIYSKKLIIVLIISLSISTFACSESGPEEINFPVIDDANSLPQPSPREIDEDLLIIWEAYQYLAREFVGRNDMDNSKLAEGAVKGMFEALNDKHSGYIPPERFKIDQTALQGKFSGIGATVGPTKDGARVLIVAPIAGSPAEEAGIKAGDIIFEVDGDDTEGWTVLDAVNRIRGKEGTPVTLKVQRIGEVALIEIKIIRGEIKLPSVTSKMITDEEYGHIKITSFTRETHPELLAALQEMDAEKAKGIVLDLRENPGGYLDVVVDIVSEFIPKNELVLYEEDGNGVRRNHISKDLGNYADLPMVILVNEFSASGSEVLTGALQDLDRAVVIGTTTFGKGSVGIQRRLSNEGGIYYTVARWYTPKGRVIEENGLEPDVVVRNKANETDDLQMMAAIIQLDFQLTQ
ncbi:MAG: S41 family peptidase [Chloroflexota bacterium]|nr:S41 family peptidase [Chloroflexota bacterium]|tara:strand:+ start:1728 stop:2957 length:1230 start_codon:yes stop_codon:yes gene_type:complete